MSTKVRRSWMDKLKSSEFKPSGGQPLLAELKGQLFNALHLTQSTLLLT